MWSQPHYRSLAPGRGEIQISIARLADRYPFHVRVLEQLDIRPEPGLTTMGLTASDDHVTLLYNPEFVKQIKLKELGGLLLHQVHHLLLGHVLADPAAYPDLWARLVAEETAANEFIREPLPGNPIRLESFPELPPTESTADRYRRLTRHHPRFPVRTRGGAILAGRRGRGKQSAEVIDEHSTWREAREHGEDVEAAIERAMQDDDKLRDEPHGSPIPMSSDDLFAGTGGQEEQHDVECPRKGGRNEPDDAASRKSAGAGGQDNEDDAEGTGDQGTRQWKPEHGGDVEATVRATRRGSGQSAHEQQADGRRVRKPTGQTSCDAGGQEKQDDAEAADDRGTRKQKPEHGDDAESAVPATRRGSGQTAHEQQAEGSRVRKPTGKTSAGAGEQKRQDHAEATGDQGTRQQKPKHGDDVEATVRAIIEEAAREAGESAVPQHLHNALVEMGIGTISGDGEYRLRKTEHAQLDWRRRLRRYVGRVLTVQHSFTWPSRRFPDLVGIIPGRRRRSGQPNVLAVIDTSGSITPELLEKINAELARLAAHYRVTVVECDAVIHRVYPYRPIRSVLGRGGTDLRPPLEPEFLRKHRPDLIVYFTDGYGPAPDTAPRPPVLWCLTPSGTTPAGWGRVIHMTDSNE